jgi:hypothetical protein
MTIADLLNDKDLKPKVKTETLSVWLIESKISVDELVAFAKTAKDSPKATCIEALEFATGKKPAILNDRRLSVCNRTSADRQTTAGKMGSRESNRQYSEIISR